MDEEGNVIPIFKFLRLHRFDEIPQFFNILKGDMSVIGPRPEPLSFHNQIIEVFPEYKIRYIIKPGLTGLSQVEYGHTTEVDTANVKFEYDMKYIKSINLMNDIKILFKTITVLFNSKGAA